MKAIELDEESRNLLRRIVERQAFRQLMAANIRAHGLKFVPELDEKILLTHDLEQSLHILRSVEDLYGKLGGQNLSLAVRGQMERIPYPTSRLELAVCLVLCDAAERVAGSGYIDSESRDFAAIARSSLAMERTSTRRGHELFIEFSAEAGNRPAAQQMFNRWLAIALVSLGRPGTPGDTRAVALRLRTKRCLDSVREYLESIKPFITACHLVVPAGTTLGVDLAPEIVATAGRA
jgi:1,2-phenylacetyl-CoA epoxidase catalytic subunit